MKNGAEERLALEAKARPAAWMHEHPERFDVIHDVAKELWIKSRPKQVEHYTIPLYRRDNRVPLSTDAAIDLVRDTLGIDPLSDCNMLKMLRAVERAHGIVA